MNFTNRIRNAWNILKTGVFPKVEVPVLKYCHQITHAVACIDFSQLKSMRAMTADERPEHVSEASKVFTNKTFKPELDAMAEAQIYWAVCQSMDAEQAAFARGTVNGIRLVEERFRELHSEHLENIKPKDKPDSDNPLPET